MSAQVTVADGKYTVINDNGKLTALRNGEPWGRDLCGDSLVYWMMVRILELEAALVPHECTCPAKDMPFGRCCKAPQPATQPTHHQLRDLRRSLPMEAGDVEFAFAVLATYGATK